jgi:hypothetical protein
VRELSEREAGMQERAAAFREQGGEVYVPEPAAE